MFVFFFSYIFSRAVSGQSVHTLLHSYVLCARIIFAVVVCGLRFEFAGSVCEPLCVSFVLICILCMIIVELVFEGAYLIMHQRVARQS